MLPGDLLRPRNVRFLALLLPVVAGLVSILRSVFLFSVKKQSSIAQPGLILKFSHAGSNAINFIDLLWFSCHIAALIKVLCRENRPCV